MSNCMPIQIKIIFEKNNGIVRGLIVFFVLHSTVKNSFTIGPFVTDSHGEIVLTKKAVEESIKLNKDQFPMDYKGDLRDCDLLSVIVESRFDIEQRIKRLKEFYPAEALALQELLKNAANSENGLRKEIILPIKEEEILITIR